MSPINLPEGMRVVEAPYLPKGTVMLVPDFSRFATTDRHHPSSVFFEDPWAVSNPAIKPYAEHERRKGLDHLSGLLDDLCRRWGMDPQKVWRDPRLRAQDNLWRNWRMDERASMAIVNPRGVVKVVEGL